MTRKYTRHGGHVTNAQVVEALTTEKSIKAASEKLGRSYNWLLMKSHELAEQGVIVSRDELPVYARGDKEIPADPIRTRRSASTKTAKAAKTRKKTTTTGARRGRKPKATLTIYFKTDSWQQDAYYLRGSFDEWKAAPGVKMKPTDNGYVSATVKLPTGTTSVEFFVNNGNDLNNGANLYQPGAGRNFTANLADGSEYTVESYDNAHSGKPNA